MIRFVCLLFIYSSVYGLYYFYFDISCTLVTIINLIYVIVFLPYFSTTEYLSLKVLYRNIDSFY